MSLKRQRVARPRAMSAQQLLPKSGRSFDGLRGFWETIRLKRRLGVPILPRQLREHGYISAGARFFNSILGLIVGLATLLFLPAVVVSSWIFVTRLFSGAEVSLLLWIIGLGATLVIAAILLALAIIGAIILVLIAMHRKA